MVTSQDRIRQSHGRLVDQSICWSSSGALSGSVSRAVRAVALGPRVTLPTHCPTPIRLPVSRLHLRFFRLIGKVGQQRAYVGGFVDKRSMRASGGIR